MQVKLETLEKVVHAIFEHMRDLGVEEVELEKDYYWHIPFEQKYDVYNQPTDLTIGQLTDDWQDIVNIAGDSSNILCVHLRDVSAILRYIGEKYPF